MTSVLECSSDLSCVQGELKVGCTISSFSFRVVLKPSKGSSYIYYFLTSFQSLTWKNVRKRLYYETLTFKSVNETFRYVRPDEIEAIEQHAVLSCCRVVVYFAVKKKKWFNFWVRVSEARQFKWKLLVMKSSSTVNYAVQGGYKVWVCGWNPKVLCCT